VPSWQLELIAKHFKKAEQPQFRACLAQGLCGCVFKIVCLLPAGILVSIAFITSHDARPHGVVYNCVRQQDRDEEVAVSCQPVQLSVGAEMFTSLCYPFGYCIKAHTSCLPARHSLRYRFFQCCVCCAYFLHDRKQHLSVKISIAGGSRIPGASLPLEVDLHSLPHLGQSQQDLPSCRNSDKELPILQAGHTGPRL